MILEGLALAWLAGAALAAVGTPHLPFLALPAGSIIAVWRFRGRRRLVGAACAVMLGAAACGGAAAFAGSRPRKGANDVAACIDVAGPKRVQGVVSADRDVTQSAVLLRLAVQRVETDAGWHAAAGALLVRAPLSLAYDYGDQIEVRGQLIQPPKFRDFDYKAYLAQQGIYAEMIYPSTHLIAQSQGNPWLARLVHLRERLADGIASVLPEPEASLGAGAALGTSRVVDPSFKADLTSTGTTWLIAADGFKVMILAGCLIGLSWLVHRRVALMLCLPVILAYALLAGFSPAVIRGAVLGAAFVCASLAGRPHGRGRVLILAAAVLTAIDPQALLGASFWASLAGAAGILWLGQPLCDGLERAWPASVREGPWGGVVRATDLTIALTIAAIPAMLPVLFAASGRAPASSVAASTLLFPFVPVIMAVSATVAVAAMIWHPLATVLAPLAYVPLAFMVGVVRVAAALPAASVSAAWFGTRWAIVSYAVTAAGLAVFRARRRAPWLEIITGLRPHFGLVTGEGRTRGDHAGSRLKVIPTLPSEALLGVLMLPVVAGSGLLLAAALRPAGDPVRLTVLDVGAGEAILVESGGRRILVDGGPSGEATVRALDSRLRPWQRSLSLVVITGTGDADAGGLPPVLSRYAVAAILDVAPPAAANKASGPSAQALAVALGASRAVSVPSQPWTAVSLGPARLVIQQEPDGAPAPASPTVTLEAGALRFLLAGDSTGSVPADVRLLPATQIQSPLQAPAIAVLETGPPARAASDLTGVPTSLRSALVYRTQENGAITLSTDGRHIRVSVGRGPRLGLFRR